MKKYFNICFLSFSLLFLGGSSLTSRIEIYSYWNFKPNVYNCQDSPYLIKEILSALKFWEKQGFIFGEIKDNYDCLSNPLNDGIYIQRANSGDMTDNQYGGTFPIVNDVGQLKHIDIKILVKKDRVLEHEIGHALGFKHYNKDENIMNRLHENGGFKVDGIFINQKL